MNYKYKELLDIIQNKQKNNKEEINNILQKDKINEKELLTLFNELVSDDNEDNEVNEKELLNNILFCKEYIKDNVTIGIVAIKKEICDIFDFDEEFMLKEKYKIVYESKVMLIDEVNCIDNLLLTRFKSEEEAIKYAEKTANEFENMSLDNIVDIIKNSI